MITLDWSWSWFALGVFGFLLGMIIQFGKYQPRIIRNGGWRLGWFLEDNKLRLILGFIVCLIYSQTMVGHSPWLFLLECIAFDRIIDSFTNRKK